MWITGRGTNLLTVLKDVDYINKQLNKSKNTNHREHFIVRLILFLSH